MGRWIREGTKMKYYDDKGNLIKTYNTNLNKGGNGGWKDGYDSNNMFQAGQAKHVEEAIQFFLQNGRMPNRDEFKNGTPSKSGYENNVLKDVRTWLQRNGIDEAKYSIDKTSFIYGKEGGELNSSFVTDSNREELLSADKETVEEPELNPYATYMEQKRIQAEGAEKGLLDAQTNAARQNADILAQQTMQQQAMARDEIIEQIKTDRLAKMRAGISPMQIAQENLQYAVGNMQANNQQVQTVNQQRLAATQQQAMNPYQAYINSMQNVTGGQGYGAVATGFAATDAGDLNMQALRYLQKNPTASYDQAMAAVKGN